MVVVSLGRMRAAVVMAAAGVMGLMAGGARAGVLGAASDYNIFVIGDMTNVQNVDVTGKVAVGGNATWNNYGVGSGLSDPTGVSLVVGGNLTNSSATLEGSAVVGGNVSWSVPSVTGTLTANGSVDLGTNGGTVNGGVFYGTTYTGPNYIPGTQLGAPVSLPISFATAATQLKATADALMALPATGTANLSFSTMTLTGTNAGLNVFDVTAADLAVTSTFNVSVPTGGTVVINVTGEGNISVPNVGYNVGDVTKVLWNFDRATGLTVSSLNGSILAPFAAVATSSGQIDGQIVAGSYTGNTEFHNFLFTGSLPTPEPASVGVLALGGAALLVRRRR